MSPTTSVLLADLALPDHQAATLELLNTYAMDPMGDGQALSNSARRDVIPGLRAHPTTLVFLAYSHGKNQEQDQKSSGNIQTAIPQPVGLAICFLGFSTFAARPLINISDYFVLPACRGAGIGQKLLADIEAHARTLGCCRLTLEVQENNHRARAIYTNFGFHQALHVPAAGPALYLSKSLQ